jgi:RHS repeat-associated protein
VATTAGQAFDELYSYDGVNQLRSFQRGSLAGGETSLASGSENFAQNWTLDATGNWVQFQEDDTGSGTWSLDQTRTHDTANEIASFAESAGPTWSQPAYDRNGNMTSMPQPGSPAASFTCTYDAWNRLVKVVVSSTGQTVAEYQYDGRGFRVLRSGYTTGTISERRHYYYNSSWQVLEERIEQSPIPNTQSLIPSSQHVWGLRYIDDIVLRDRVSERLYYVQDANWNVTSLLDTAANPLERYVYDAYGTVTVYDGAWGSAFSASAFDNETLYTGRQLDPDTGLYGYRTRYFASGVGTFLGADSVGYQGGDPNLYRYVGNQPLVYVDPWGQANQLTWWQGAIGSVLLPALQTGQWLTSPLRPLMPANLVQRQDQMVDDLYDAMNFSPVEKHVLSITCGVWAGAAAGTLGLPRTSVPGAPSPPPGSTNPNIRPTGPGPGRGLGPLDPPGPPPSFSPYPPFSRN